MTWQGWLGVWIVGAICAQAAPTDRPNASAGQRSSAAAQAPSTDALERFNKRLEEVDGAVGKVVDVRARFEQRRQTALLKRPMVSRGEMIARGASVRWETREPRRSTMTVGTSGEGGGSEIRMYYPDDRLVEVYEGGAKEKGLMGAILPRLAELRARFELSALAVKEMGGAEDNPRLLAVALEPREEGVRRHVRSVRVLIDGSIPAAIRVVVVDAQGETTDISFADVRVNTGVTREEVELRAPGDVRVSYPMRGEGARGAAPAGSAPRTEAPSTQTPPSAMPPTRTDDRGNAKP